MNVRYVKWMGVLLVAIWPLLSAGCATPGARRSRDVPGKTPATRPDSHLVFNPQGSGTQGWDVSRAPWPGTAAGPGPGESVEYTEVMIDRSGQNGRDDGYTYRRFRSVRRGRAGR